MRPTAIQRDFLRACWFLLCGIFYTIYPSGRRAMSTFRFVFLFLSIQRDSLSVVLYFLQEFHTLWASHQSCEYSRAIIDTRRHSRCTRTRRWGLAKHFFGTENIMFSNWLKVRYKLRHRSKRLSASSECRTRENVASQVDSKRGRLYASTRQNKTKKIEKRTVRRLSTESPCICTYMYTGTDKSAKEKPSLKLRLLLHAAPLSHRLQSGIRDPPFFNTSFALIVFPFFFFRVALIFTRRSLCQHAVSARRFSMYLREPHSRIHYWHGFPKIRFKHRTTLFFYTVYPAAYVFIYIFVCVCVCVSNNLFYLCRDTNRAYNRAWGRRKKTFFSGTFTAKCVQ